MKKRTSPAPVSGLRMVFLTLLVAACSSRQASKVDETVANSAEKEVLSFDDCVDHSGGITQNLLHCAATEQARLDRLLRSALRQSMAELSPAGQMDLETEQRKWNAEIIRTCENEPEQKEFEGGSWARVIFRVCLLSKTGERVSVLQTRLDESRNTPDQ